MKKPSSFLEKLSTKVLINKNSQEIFSKAGSYLFIHVFGVIITFGLSYFVSKTHGAAAWGAFAIFFNYLTIISLISGFGLDIFVIKLYNQNDRNDSLLSSIITFVGFSSLLVGLGHYIFGEHFLRLLHFGPESKGILNILVFAVPVFALNNLIISIFRGIRNTTFSGFLRNTFIWAATGLVYLFLYWRNSSSGEMALVQGYFFAGIGSVGLGIFYLFRGKYLEFRLPTLGQVSGVFKSLRLAYPFLFIYLIQAANVSFDRFIIQELLDLKNVGVYDIILKINSVPNLIYAAVNAILLPKFSQLYENGNMDGMKKVAIDSSKMIFFLSLPVIGGLLICSKWLIAVFGDDFDSAFVPLMILLLGQIIINLAGSGEAVLQMTDNQKSFQWLFAVSMIINLGGCFLLVPHLGLIGGAISKLLSVLFWRFGASIMSYRKLGISTIYLSKSFRT